MSEGFGFISILCQLEGSSVTLARRLTETMETKDNASQANVTLDETTNVSQVFWRPNNPSTFRFAATIVTLFNAKFAVANCYAK